jgi:hypothetical protein
MFAVTYSVPSGASTTEPYADAAGSGSPGSGRASPDRGSMLTTTPVEATPYSSPSEGSNAKSSTSAASSHGYSRTEPRTETCPGWTSTAYRNPRPLTYQVFPVMTPDVMSTSR